MSDMKSLLETIDRLGNEELDAIELHDSFDIEIDDNFVIETGVIGFTEDGVILESDDQMLEYLSLHDMLTEAEYHGRKVPLGKPMKGDVKKSKVYVRKPNGKVVKVNFGDKNMRIKKNSPGHRKSFRARHHCENPGPRWKARYWSCRAW
jgi:hypothetical protein